MKPYYKDDSCTIYHGDALEVLPRLNVQVGGIITDPPYCSGGRQQASTRKAYTKAENSGADWFDGDNMGTDSYMWWLRSLGRQMFDMCVTGGHLYMFTDWRQFSTVVTSLETVRWTLRSSVVWSKNRSGAMGSFWRNDFELVPVFTKGKSRPLPNGGFFNVLTASKPQREPHPTTKPYQVLQRLVEACGDYPEPLLDPFMGSGTTLRAAKDLGRKAIGIEIEERYCEVAAKRLEQEVLAS